MNKINAYCDICNHKRQKVYHHTKDNIIVLSKEQHEEIHGIKSRNKNKFNNFEMLIMGFAHLINGIIMILCLGFYHGGIPLFVAKKIARHKL